MAEHLTSVIEIRLLNLLTNKAASVISHSEEYCSFRSSVPQRKIVVDEDQQKVWTLYDAGPPDISCPLVCLPPVSGTADVFFKQIMGLSARGYRVISVHYPNYWTMREWCIGFQRLLDHLNLNKVHVFGASLGGFLAQKFCEQTAHCPRIHSLILCNSFTDTSIFNYTDSAVLFWMTPAIILKRMIMTSFSKGPMEAKIADSIDFMVEKLEGLSQTELASRLTLNCMNSYVQPHRIHGQDVAITILDVFDEGALSQTAREDMYKLYPTAKRAHLKSGGNFPYLSRSDEVNLHIQVHLRQFRKTKYTPRDDSVECDVQTPSTPLVCSSTENIFERSL